MFDRPQQVRNYPTKLCAVCGGRFGLIRRYVCRTALCSNKCVNRFKARRENDRNWLLRCQVV
jgi:RNA polymerase-binding transcription factor DksA